MSSSLPDGFEARCATGADAWLVHGGGRLAGAATLWHGDAPNVWGDVYPEALGRGLENSTGATRLYERAGMHVEDETVTFEKSRA